MSMLMPGTAGIQSAWRVGNLDYAAQDNPRGRAAWSRWWGADTTDLWDDAVLWPNSSMQGGAYLEATRFEPMPRLFGTQSQRKLIGLSKDSTGAILPTSVMKAIRTSDDLFVSQVISDAGGYFELITPYAGVAHRIDIYKAGSPDLAGSSVNTLVPS